MKKETLKRNWILHYIRPEYLYLPRKEKDNKKGHQVFIYLRQNRGSDWSTLNPEQLQNTVIGVYNSKEELIYCTAYNNNGTIVSTLAGSGFAIQKLPYIDTDYDVSTVDYLILPYGDYTVKVMRYGTNLNTYTGENSFTFTVINDGQTGTLQYVYVNLFSEDYIDFKVTLESEMKTMSELYDTCEYTIQLPSSYADYIAGGGQNYPRTYLEHYTSEMELTNSETSAAYGSPAVHEPSSPFNTPNRPTILTIPKITYYRHYKDTIQIIGNKAIPTSTTEAKYIIDTPNTEFIKDFNGTWHLYLSKKKYPYIYDLSINNSSSSTLDRYKGRGILTFDPRTLRGSTHSATAHYGMADTMFDGQVVIEETISGECTGISYTSTTISYRGYVKTSGYTKYAPGSVYDSFEWYEVPDSLSATAENVDEMVSETISISRNFLLSKCSEMSNIIPSLLDASYVDERGEGVREYEWSDDSSSITFSVTRNVACNTSTAMDIRERGYDPDIITYDPTSLGLLYDTVWVPQTHEIPLVVFPSDYSEYTIDDWTYSRYHPQLYRYKPLIVDMSDVPNYTP